VSRVVLFFISQGRERPLFLHFSFTFSFLFFCGRDRIHDDQRWVAPVTHTHTHTHTNAQPARAWRVGRLSSVHLAAKRRPSSRLADLNGARYSHSKKSNLYGRSNPSNPSPHPLSLSLSLTGLVGPHSNLALRIIISITTVMIPALDGCAPTASPPLV